MTVALTVPGLLAEQARSRPAATAVVTPEGSVTYRDVLDRATDLATRLVAMGVRKGTVIALLLPNGLDWVAWWAACTRIGAVAVPMNTFATPAEVRRVLEHSGAHLFVAVPAFAGHAYRDDLEEVLGTLGPGDDRVSSQLPQLRRVLWTDLVPAVAPAPRSRELVEALAADVAAADVLTIIYSSGSTGDPKGVVHSHGTALRQAARLARLTRTHASTVLWTSMPLNWVGGLVWSFLRTAVAGGTFVTQARFEAGATLALFRATGVDTVTAWGPVVEQLRAHPDYDPTVFADIVGLGPLATSGASRPSALGMTETLGPHSGWFGGPDDEVPAGSMGSMGQALPGMEHRIVDPETGTDLPDGEVGELLVRGDTLMLGLHRRERGEVLTPDGWYRTRDAAALRDGWLFFHGRLDDVIKTSGANVSPAEVTAVLGEDQAVRHAFVVGVPHPLRGEDVVAFVVAAAGPVDVEALLARARRRLAPYKVPRRVLVIAADDVPWLSSQKVDVRLLRSMAAAELPERERVSGP